MSATPRRVVDELVAAAVSVVTQKPYFPYATLRNRT